MVHAPNTIGEKLRSKSKEFVRTDESCGRKQRDHITERGHVSMTRHNLVHNPVPKRLRFFLPIR